MAITVEFYLNNSDPNYIRKNITNKKSFDCIIKDDSNIEEPTIQIQGDMSLIANYNYAYIPLYGRYYFFENTDPINANILEINLISDPLMSFKNEILELEGVIERQEKLFNLYYNDPVLKKLSYEQIQTISFKNKLSVEPTFILLTTGGASIA